MHHPFLTAAHTHDKTFKKPAHPLSPPLAQSTHWPATSTSLPQHLTCLARLITDLFKSAFPSLPPHWRATLTASSSTPGRVYLSLPCLPLDALQTLIGPSQASTALSLEKFSSYALSPLPCKINQIHLWLCHPLDPLHPTEGLGILIRQAYKHCSRLASHWLPQLPPWYEEPLFHQWNQQRLKDLNPSKTRPEAHPFHHHLLHSLLSSKPPLVTITNPLNPSDPPLKTKINISTDLINHLWSQHLDPVGLQQSYPQIAQSYAQRHANTWLQTLAAKWTPDFLNSMSVFDSATWHTLLWATFQRTCRHKYHPSEQEAPLIDALKKALRAHQHSHAALLCKQELPLLLKDYYPLARKLNRTIKVVLGPTNSGKTHAALEALSHAKSGSYLGPLRLLALEVYDRLNDDYNIPTSLITGEQVQLKTLDGYPAAHKACTVEMLDFTTPQDVIVIDEAQMVQDPHRGSAWLHAILGAPAKTLYILGSPEARPALEHLLKSTGEQYSIEIKNRLSAPVVVDPQPASSYNVPPSSAIIAFSRKKVLEIAEYLKSKGQTPAVIYGSLPPDVRRKQSELFSTGQAPVLVATDAIGLGLNLPISRIYFSSIIKSNGVREEPLDPHLLWQIAGRAGRFGHSEAGSIHAFNSSDLAYIRECLSSRPEPLNGQFYCNLTTPIAEKIAEHLATSKLASVYSFFKDYIELTTSTRTIVSNVTDEQLMLAKLLDQQPSLSLSEKLLLSNAPAIYRDLDPHFHGFVQAISKNKEYPTQALLCQLTPHPHTPLADLETTIKTLNLWAWLHYRFEHVFLHRQQVLELQNTINQRIHTLLLSNAKKNANHRTARSGSHFKNRRP